MGKSDEYQFDYLDDNDLLKVDDELEEDLWSVENVIRTQNQAGGYDAEQICEILRKNGAASL